MNWSHCIQVRVLDSSITRAHSMYGQGSEETTEKPLTFFQVLTGEPAFVGLEHWLLLLVLYQGTFDNV